MNVMENKIYFTYMVLGSLYFISKLIYYIFGWVCFAGLMLGLVASVLTILIGIASFKEYKKAGKPIAHWWAVIGPLIIILYSPFHMTMRLGIPVFRFLAEKMSILSIFEALAIAQLILSILMYKERSEIARVPKSKGEMKNMFIHPHHRLRAVNMKSRYRNGM